MARETRAVWAGRIARWQRSGLTAARFAGREGINPPLPDHLRRVDVELIPLEVQQQGLDQFERIGAEVIEVLERRPASAVVVRVIRPKFVPKDRLRNAPTPVL